MTFDPTNKSSMPTLTEWEAKLNEILLGQLQAPQPIFWHKWARTPDTRFIMGCMAYELSIHAFLQGLASDPQLKAIAEDLLGKPMTPEIFEAFLARNWLNQHYWFSLLDVAGGKRLLN